MTAEVDRWFKERKPPAEPAMQRVREVILRAVWGYEHPIETRVIDVHIRNLRRKIEPDPAHPRYILAVPGIGYRFASLKP